jgi:hypothetical protein
MNFDQTPEFKKELKKLQKKWRSLPQDITDAELQITDLYTDTDGNVEYRSAFFNGRRATILQLLDDGREVVKMRLDVQSLGTSDKVRIVFIAIVTSNSILFVELFAKNEKPREDLMRIKKYTK